MTDVAPLAEETINETPDVEITPESEPAAEEPNEFLSLIDEGLDDPIDEVVTPAEPSDPPEVDPAPVLDTTPVDEVIPTVEPEAVVPEADLVPEPEPEPEMTLEQVQEQFAANYGMSEEDITAFEADPGKVLPTLLARVQIQTMQQTVQAMRQMLPQLVKQINTQETASSEVGTEFKTQYASLQDLSKAEQQQLLSVAKNTRTMFPDETPSQVMHRAVKGFAALTGKVLDASPAPTPAAQPSPSPHQPAMGSSTALPGGEEKTVWDEMVDD